MKIGIDISQIVYEGSGVARFTHGLTQAICKYDSDNTWVFFYSSLRRSLPQDVERLIIQSHHKTVHALLPPTLLSFLWNDAHMLSPEIVTGKLDWFITSDWTEPPMSAKKATIVHDLAFLRYPETVHKTILRTQKKRMKWVTQESNLIFTDSQSTREDAIHYLKVPDKNVVTNYPGIDDGSIVTKKHSSTRTVLNEYGARPFILTVGKREPRKNLDRLIQAFVGLGQDEVDLYIVGAYGWGMDVVDSGIQNMDGAHHVKFSGFVSDEKLQQLYTNSLAFIFPSIWEGFGYPVLEAMANGTPVATSNTSSLKEVAGNAAILFDPLNVSSITEALHKLISDDSLRNMLKEKGRKRAQEFTWKRYVDNLINELQTRL